MAVTDRNERTVPRPVEPDLAAVRLWKDALDHLRVRINREGFDTWLSVTGVRSLSASAIELEVPNSFFADWITQHYLGEIRAVLRDLIGRDLAVSFRARDAADARALRRGRADIPNPPRSGVGRLRTRYTFDCFVVGESNRFACAAARSVAEHPGATYNPLFIYGGVGLGKTHLVHAIGNHALELRPELRVHYVPAETFFLELIRAIEKNTRLDFKSRYRTLDLLLMDDVHYLVGKERLQEEVFHIFNTLHDSGSQIVFTCDRPPREIPTLEERLASRLGSGLVVDIGPPDLEMRIAILKQKAAREEQELPHDVALYIASRVKSNIRELEGSLVRLLALSSLTDRPLSVELAEETLKDLLARVPSVTPDMVIEAAARAWGVTAADIRSNRRTQQLALARQVAMYLIRKNLGLSLKEIGLCFGGKDHTTVMHAVDKVERLRVEDEPFAARLRKLDSGISGGQAVS